MVEIRTGSSSSEAFASPADTVIIGFRPIIAEVMIPDSDILAMPEDQRNKAFVNLFVARMRSMSPNNPDPNKEDYVGIINGKLNSLVPGFKMPFELSSQEVSAGQAIKDIPVLDSWNNIELNKIPNERRWRANTLSGKMIGTSHYELLDTVEAVARRSTFDLRGKVLKEPGYNGGDWYLDRVVLRADFESQARAQIALEDQQAASEARAERVSPTVDGGQSSPIHRGNLTLVYSAIQEQNSPAAA